MEDPSGARIPKACRTCAKAKVRCEPQADGTCKRCRRLNKDCGDQAPGAHRRLKSTKSNLEVSVLEAKLDRMVALLASSEKAAKDLQSSAPSSLSPGQSSSANHDEITNMTNKQEADTLLEIFRTRMSPLFPFIVVPAHMTAEQLRREKPFLFLNITMVSCQDALRQRDIVTAVKHYIAEHIVSEGEHNMDLLQGLLVHVSWFISVPRLPEEASNTDCVNIDVGPQAHVRISAQLDVIIQLAMAQIISLNLNQGRAALRSLDRPLSYLKAADFQPNQIPPRTLEERRAYLGCYYLSVMLTTCVRDMEPVRFTKYTHECCKVLEETAELPTDSYLVHLVRVMRLADKVYFTMSEIESTDSPTALSTPLALSIQCHQAELEKLKSDFSCDPPSPYSTIISFHYNTIEIILYRIFLNEHIEFSDLPYGEYSVNRLNILFRCLEATKSFIYHFDSMPLCYMIFLPFTLWCQFGLALVTLSRLTLYQGADIGWDQAYVQNILDVDQVADRVVQRLREAQDIYCREDNPLRGSGEQPRVLQRLELRMQFLKQVHRKRREAQQRAHLQAPQDSEPLDLSFMENVPMDLFFPYGNYAQMPSTFVPTTYF